MTVPPFRERNQLAQGLRSVNSAPRGVPMSENRRIVRAAGLVGLLTLLSRIAGLVRDAVVGYYFGTGMAADAFFVAFRLPNLLRRFVAEGAMSVAFIPVFTDYRDQPHARGSGGGGLGAGQCYGRWCWRVLVAVGWCSRRRGRRSFAPGFVDEPGKFALTVTLTRMVFPYIFLISLVALASGMLNSLRHFAAPALSPVFLNLAIIAAAVFLSPASGGAGDTGWRTASLIGGVCQLALQMPPLLRRRRAHRPAVAAAARRGAPRAGLDGADGCSGRPSTRSTSWWTPCWPRCCRRVACRISGMRTASSSFRSAFCRWRLERRRCRASRRKRRGARATSCGTVCRSRSG